MKLMLAKDITLFGFNFSGASYAANVQTLTSIFELVGLVVYSLPQI